MSAASWFRPWTLNLYYFALVSGGFSIYLLRKVRTPEVALSRRREKRLAAAARKKVEAAGGRAVDLLELAVKNPKGSGVRILG